MHSMALSSIKNTYLNMMNYQRNLKHFTSIQILTCGRRQRVSFIQLLILQHTHQSLVFFRHVDIIYSAWQPVTSNAKLQSILYQFNVELKYLCTAFWTHLMELQHLVSYRATAPNKFNYITRALNSKVTCESVNPADIHSIGSILYIFSLVF